MSTKFKPKTLADESDDEDALSMLDSMNSEQPEWARDNNGDLDWAYTARCARSWSHDTLLSHLCDKSFSIPAREYNPSAPFVYVRMLDGEVVTLPHGYRLPLMFVGKYIWETILSKVLNEATWKAERANLFHLSRLCQNLFRRARAKALKGGMEKGWRSLMFDRLLARFYKHWTANDPKSGPKFVSTHSVKEYDRDVLKHDWKRWCLRGLGSVRMTEDEVNNGITHEEFRKTLGKNERGAWVLNGQYLAFVTTEEGQAWSSSSELTEDEDNADGNEEDDREDEEENEHEESHEDARGVEEEVVVQAGKRRRDDQQLNRSSKRSKLSPQVLILHERSKASHDQPPLTKTLAAIKQRLAMPRSSPPPEVIMSISAPTASTSQLPRPQTKIEYTPISIPSLDCISVSDSASTPTATPARPSTTIKLKPPPKEPTRSSTRNVPRPYLGLPNPLARNARPKLLGPVKRKPTPAPKKLSLSRPRVESISSSEDEEEDEQSGVNMPPHVVTSKALELLINLVGAKKPLDTGALSSLTAGASSTGSGDTQVASSSSLIPGSDRQELESRFQNFEGRFLSVKEELLGILGRLQALENHNSQYRELERIRNDRVFVDMGVDCQPPGVSQEIQTEAEVREHSEDVEMRDVSSSMKVSYLPVALFREIAVQTATADDNRPLVSPRLAIEAEAQLDVGLPPSATVEVGTQPLDQDFPCIGSASAQTDSTLEPSISYDSRTDLIRSNLSDVVDNLVSVKMLALTQAMAKAKQDEGSVSGMETPNALVSPTLGGHMSQTFVTNSLMAELKSMREEARARDQREKEEMDAMRQLHSAEVDALRRRLSYLESQTRHSESSTSIANRYRSTSAHSLHFDNGSSSAHHNHLSAPGLGDPVENGRRSRQRYHQSNGRLSPSYGLGESENMSSSHVFSPLLRPTNPAEAPESASAMPTPTPSERNYSFTRPALEIDDDIPLPIKSQRKQHIMAFARTHLG